MRQGQISVQSENIFPIIKKFLYTDQEIFLRELVSNAVDATKKLSTLSRVGEFDDDPATAKVIVKVDEKKKTITISDSGIGMTEEEVEKYITQLAFSGARDFVEKWKDKDPAQMIGHFGLGFYSAFMVADKVTIETKSYQKGSKAVHWECDGSTSYEIGDGKRKKRGTDVILHLNEESVEAYGSTWKVRQLLEKYCKFLPVEIEFEDKVLNNPNPIWVKKPSELEGEDYKKFFEELYPMQEAPLFHIHINTDYPFNLTGVLYFPKVNQALDNRQNRVQLYCNQVFVTEDVKDVLPEYLVLLQGVIDSPDIPLNVSRSSLQSDSNVKKITSHISKKVSDKLTEMFKNDRKDYESKWEYVDLFVKYGSLADEKFAERTKDIAMLKDTDGHLYTIQEYLDRAAVNQKDKDGDTVVLYCSDPKAQHLSIKSAKEMGYDVMIMDGPLDTQFASWCEQKFEKTKFRNVDGGNIDELIEKETTLDSVLSKEEVEGLENSIKSLVNETAFTIKVSNLSTHSDFISVSRSEWERRMDDYAKFGQSMPFGDLGLKKQNLVINPNNPMAAKILTKEGDSRSESLRYCIDLALLKKGQLQGEDLERFIAQASKLVD